MKPADNEEFRAATKQLLDGGPCLFDLSRNGAKLQSTSFGSMCYTSMENKYHLFVGDSIYGHWVIVQKKLSYRELTFTGCAIIIR